MKFLSNHKIDKSRIEVEIKTPFYNLNTANPTVLKGERIAIGSSIRFPKPDPIEKLLHYHPNEQFIYVLKGRIRAVVGDEEMILEPGWIAHIPPNTLHRNVAVEEGTHVLFFKDTLTWGIDGIPKDKTPWEILTMPPKEREELEEKY